MWSSNLPCACKETDKRHAANKTHFIVKIQASFPDRCSIWCRMTASKYIQHFIPGDNKGVRPSCQSLCAIWSKDMWHWSFSVRLVLPKSLPAKKLSYIISFPYSVSYYMSISHSFLQIMMSVSNTFSLKLINSVYVTTITNIFGPFKRCQIYQYQRGF